MLERLRSIPERISEALDPGNLAQKLRKNWADVVFWGGLGAIVITCAFIALGASALPEAGLIIGGAILLDVVAAIVVGANTKIL